ncbi:hypothetical protein [uncultured Mediterranean phage]|nr:hypothetical protein [uncultured Mediterranean phage]
MGFFGCAEIVPDTTCEALTKPTEAPFVSFVGFVGSLWWWVTQISLVYVTRRTIGAGSPVPIKRKQAIGYPSDTSTPETQAHLFSRDEMSEGTKKGPRRRHTARANCGGKCACSGGRAPAPYLPVAFANRSRAAMTLSSSLTLPSTTPSFSGIRRSDTASSASPTISPHSSQGYT